MANEVTVPLLPCPDIDEIAAFYGVLGFHATHRQLRPNPYVALQREDLNLHFFGMPEFDADNSYGTCLVVVEDIGALHRAFADGTGAAYGKVLIAGRPRMTRPRVRKNANGVTGFSIVDPGGNWIRITTSRPAAVGAGKAESRLANALQNAVVQGDSHGDHAQAAKILDGALRKSDQEDATVLAEALTYRAELALVLDDPASAAAALDRARELGATDADLADLV